MAPPPPGAGGAADGPEAWYKSLPIITRCWFTACVLSTVKFLPYRLSFACDQTMYRVSRRRCVHFVTVFSSSPRKVASPQS